MKWYEQKLVRLSVHRKKNARNPTFKSGGFKSSNLKNDQKQKNGEKNELVLKKMNQWKLEKD